jgi:hypothetical protein
MQAGLAIRFVLYNECLSHSSTKHKQQMKCSTTGKRKRAGDNPEMAYEIFAVSFAYLNTYCLRNGGQPE